MMTLWIPRIDYAKSFRSLGVQITAQTRSTLTLPDQHCVLDYNLGFAQRATLEYHADVAFQRKPVDSGKTKCDFLIIQDDRRTGFSIRNEFELSRGERWNHIWTGNRNSDRHEFFFLYQRKH